MKQTMTFWISKRIAKRYGTRAAAVFGWLFAQCQAQVPRDECKLVGLARVYRKSVRVKVSCCELGRLLHLSRHTVEAILKRFEAEGIINVWLPRGEDRTRAYSIAPEGFTLLHRWLGEWHVNAEELLSSWGLDTRVASRVGVNAAIVFQHLWHWSRNYRWGSHYTKGSRAWLPYTAAELSRWLPFLSDDVVEAALHTLVAAGLLEKMRQGRVTKWSITDSGFAAMGEIPPVRGVHRMRGRYYSSWGGTAVVGSLGDPEGAVYTSETPAEDAAAYEAHEARQAAWLCGGTAMHTGQQEDWAMAVARIKAARNRRRRLRRKGLSEWSCLSL